MKRFLVAIIFVLSACGDDYDTLNPIEGEEGFTSDTGTVTVVIVEDDETIVVEEVVPEPVEDDIVKMEEYPEGYCESELWVLECAFDVAVLAIGPGCEKHLEIVFGEGSEVYCE